MTVDDLQLRRAVVCASGLLYWGGVILQARRIRRRIGHSPNVRPRGPKEKALWLGWFLVILAWVGQPWLMGGTVDLPGLRLFPALLHPAVMALGLVLVALGYAGTLWTYAVMGSSWRIGVNAQETTLLVRHGPFHWVRHPIYALQAVMLIGAGLLLPTTLSFAIVATHYVCVRLKVRDEELYLERVHGAAYREYCSQTGRLFPRCCRRAAADSAAAGRT